MMLNVTKLFVLTLLSGWVLLSSAQASEGYGHQKVVYHINYDDAKKQSSTLRNIQNHINAVGADNLDIKVVLHGNGLSLLLKEDALKNVPKFKAANASTEMQQKVDSLRMQGVVFDVCANTLKGRNVDYKRDLYDVDQKDIVPSGVAELAHLQEEGFVYLRP
ncbi:DsrE family protein [Thiomicrospira sp. S5]|jgi:intracellular sulfur oxidation DsrE/DsrF family protein|uniref:DsrE family protein n=1 Tax=Thiomicrospira sp. S5 TaxID=1803865 RepID=UPI000F89FA66|nr:DsrE family protein [Thiomicrospira sp. S5]AZR80998.1 hypothetical protein AYJ59_01015 [Thiomicrospira sp. S5]